MKSPRPSKSLHPLPTCLKGQDFCSILLTIADDFPILSCFYVPGKIFLATAFSPCPVDEYLSREIKTAIHREGKSPFPEYHYFGAIPYAFDFRSCEKQSRSQPSLEKNSDFSAIAYRIYDYLIFNMESGALEYFREPGVCASSIKYNLNFNRLKIGPSKGLREINAIPLVPRDTPSDYIRLIQQIIEDIKDGKYYQLNFLRFFDLAVTPTRRSVIARYLQQRYPGSSVIESNQTSIYSLSPEIFFRTAPRRQSQGTDIFLYPIKGTVASHPEPTKNQVRIRSLLSSKKDRAELAMIIDLMRNDLYAIADKGSITLIDPYRIKSFNDLHHMQAEIKAHLRSQLAWRDVWQALFPSGSITGAPKKEVMTNIAAYEKRSRGYFMGSIFLADCNDDCISNVLIRTLVNHKNKWGYAAGGGITSKSIPELEYEETITKTRCITSSQEGINPT